MQTAPRQSGSYWLSGLRPYLALWRARGLLVWLAYKATFGARWLWARNSVPGKLLVSTNSAVAVDVLSPVFSGLRGPVPRLHQVLDVHDLIEPTSVTGTRPTAPKSDSDSADGRRRPVAAAWLVYVRPGTEQAVLREIEYRVASEMAKRGGYAGLGHRCMLAVGRAAIAATPVRRLLPSAKLTFPGPVELGPDHDVYKQLLQLGPWPERKVRVAVLDTNIQLGDLPPKVRCRVKIVAGTEPLDSWTPFAHGAVTVSVIGDVAENAYITLHPVLGGDGEFSAESALLNVLYDIGDGKIDAEVIVLCLGIRPDAPMIATTKTNLDRALEGLASDKMVVVATGNSPNKDLEVLEPARRAAVFAIGAANRLRRRSSFSRYVFPAEDRPAIYLLAPGGDYDPDGRSECPATVESRCQRGSSVAAAYAAAVIARSLGSTPRSQQRAAVSAALAEAAIALGPESGAGPGCAGLIQELTAGWHEGAAALTLPTERLPEHVVVAGATLARPVGTPALEESDLRDPALDIWVA